jgi:hypothetical protein
VGTQAQGRATNDPLINSQRRPPNVNAITSLRPVFFGQSLPGRPDLS